MHRVHRDASLMRARPAARLNRAADALIGAAAADVAGHGGVDVGVGRASASSRAAPPPTSAAPTGSSRTAAPARRSTPPAARGSMVGDSPSIVVTFLPPTRRHRRRRTTGSALPSRCTVQAPHCDRPQPNFVPVRPMVSRITQSSGMSGADVDVVPLAVDGQGNHGAASVRPEADDDMGTKLEM